MTNKDYCVFILSHGRADRVFTYETLRNQGYTGEIYIVIDDLDKERDKYIKRFKDKVIIFNKKEVAEKTDTIDNFQDLRAVVYARNKVFDIAEELGYEYFIVLDDDYTQFNFRFNNKYEYTYKKVENLDRLFDILFEYYKNTKNLLTLSIAQGGDFIGGKSSSFSNSIKTKRKAMNVFLCSTKRRFQFFGTINEDVNSYVLLGSRGYIFLTTNQIAIEQKTTQTNPGGLTTLYLDSGTYIKSFYTIILAPASVKIFTMGNKYKRLHHFINWDNTVPKIIREKWKK